jgi:hypothetical protein
MYVCMYSINVLSFRYRRYRKDRMEELVLEWLEDLKKSDFPDLQTLMLRCTTHVIMCFLEESAQVQQIREKGVNVVVSREQGVS